MFWHNQQLLGDQVSRSQLTPRRLLTTEEVMALQGIFTDDFPAAPSFIRTQKSGCQVSDTMHCPRTLCRDLSGNAFSLNAPLQTQTTTPERSFYGGLCSAATSSFIHGSSRGHEEAAPCLGTTAL